MTQEPKVAALRRVSAYRTTDNVIHETRIAAVRHQARVDLLAIVSSRLGTTEPLEEPARLTDDLIAQADRVARLLRDATKKG